MDNNKYFEIDVYPFSKNTAICEIELNSEHETFHFPNYINIIKEVTNDKSYSNRMLAEAIPLDLLN